MSTPQRPFTLALVVWTFLVWTTRIRNIWEDAALTDGDKLGRTALALSFTVLAAVVGVALVRRSARGTTAVLVLAGWTIGVWATRAIGIARGDHDGAFIAVHLALAVVSCALSAGAVRDARLMQHDVSSSTRM